MAGEFFDFLGFAERGNGDDEIAGTFEFVAEVFGEMDEGIGFFESFFVGLFGDGVLLRFAVRKLGVFRGVVIGKRTAGVGRFLR